MTLALSLALAAAAFALLWPEERGTTAGRARALFFAGLAAVVGFALSGRQADRSASADTSRAFKAYTEGLLNARALEASRWMDERLAGLGGVTATERRRGGATGRRGDGARGRRGDGATGHLISGALAKPIKSPVRSYAEAVRLAPDSTLFRQQYAILLADSGHREEALQQLREVARIRAARHQAPGSDLWESLYGPRLAGRAELPSLIARLHRLHLGWFEYLALRTVYRRMGLTRQAAEASDAAGREAAFLNGALGAMLLGMLGLGVLGLGLLIAALVRWRRGQLRTVPAGFHAGAAPLLEAFILYLFLFVFPELLTNTRRLPRWLAPGRSAALTIALLLGSDLISLIAVFYLWARLRALGLTLREIGLHTRELGRNILSGLGGYAAALPLVVGSAALAGWLGSRYFPQFPPPFHPIEALTLNAPSGWIRFSLLIVAAVGAPILEETFFRGLLYGALRRRFGVAAGIVGSAALFSSLHPQLPLGFVPIFVLGAVMAGLYEWRQSLVPGMVLHAVNNGVIWIYLNLVFPPA